MNSRVSEGRAYPNPTSGWSVTAIAPATRRRAFGGVLHEAPAEASLDAEIALRNRVLERRRGLENLAVLHVEAQRAAHATVGADRVGRRLTRFVPRAVGAHVEFLLGHQRA